MKKTLLAILAIIMVLSLFAGCAATAQADAQPTFLSSTDGTAPERTPAVTPPPGHDPSDYSPTTGLENTTTEYKPIMVQIDNEYPARPQRGVQWADIVYETLIEGVDTRFSCIFNDILYSEDSPEELEVGPIRSSRYYHQWIQGEWDALYVHQGGAETPGAVTDIWGESNDHIKMRINGAGKHPQNADLLYRRQNGKKLEHTAYTELHTDSEIIDYTPTQYQHFQFYPAQAYEEYPTIEKVELSFLSTPGWAEFRYNPTLNTLERYMKDKEFVCEETGSILEVQNLIIQYTHVAEFNDGAGRKQVDMFGSGQAEFFINGKHLTGTWSREEGANTETKYLLESGEEVTLAPGNTWIAVHPDNKQVVVTYADGTTSTTN